MMNFPIIFLNYIDGEFLDSISGETDWMQVSLDSLSTAEATGPVFLVDTVKGEWSSPCTDIHRNR